MWPNAAHAAAVPTTVPAAATANACRARGAARAAEESAGLPSRSSAPPAGMSVAHTVSYTVLALGRAPEKERAAAVAIVTTTPETTEEKARTLSRACTCMLAAMLHYVLRIP